MFEKKIKSLSDFLSGYPYNTRTEEGYVKVTFRLADSLTETVNKLKEQNRVLLEEKDLQNKEVDEVFSIEEYEDKKFISASKFIKKKTTGLVKIAAESLQALIKSHKQLELTNKRLNEELKEKDRIIKSLKDTIQSKQVITPKDKAIEVVGINEYLKIKNIK